MIRLPPKSTRPYTLFPSTTLFLSTEQSTPSAIRPEVQRLVARLRSRWNTEEAIRAFADELDDATGDLVAANLILAARRRGAGLAQVLESLAESVSADVRARRQIEADRKSVV